MEKDQLKQEIQLPPGFRFHPTDEELIVHYLGKKITKIPLPAAIIAEVELYRFNPWDLPKKALFGEEEWYFFTPRDRKYPNGMRPNRMATSGYWKATGTDKPILSSSGAKVIGVKKALVFYTGRPPKGSKTDWIMHEYRLPEATWTTSTKKERSMRLDDWVLCRVRQKIGMPGNFWEDRNCPTSKEPVQCPPKLDKRCPIPAGTTTTTAPSFDIVREYLYKDIPMLPYLFSSQDFPCMDTVSNPSFEGNKTSSQTPCMDTVSNISFEGNKTSSICEDNFNVYYLQNSIPTSSNGLLDMRKRKIIEGNSEVISFPLPHKKQTDRGGQREEIPESTSNDTTGTVSCSTNQKDKNNSNMDQLGSIVMYQDLYSLAFA